MKSDDCSGATDASGVRLVKPGRGCIADNPIKGAVDVLADGIDRLDPPVSSPHHVSDQSTLAES